MCECLYVYCVMNTSGIPVEMRLFSTWAKADEYRKVLKERYSGYHCYYVETLEVD